MSLSTIISKQLDNQCIGDIIKAFTLAINTEQQEILANQQLLNKLTEAPTRLLTQRLIDKSQQKIDCFKSTFYQLTGLQFASDLSTQ